MQIYKNLVIRNVLLYVVYSFISKAALSFQMSVFQLLIWQTVKMFVKISDPNKHLKKTTRISLKIAVHASQ